MARVTDDYVDKLIFRVWPFFDLIKMTINGILINYGHNWSNLFSDWKKYWMTEF